MADNFLYIPFLNPVRFYDVTRATTANYQTKHFDDFMFAERLFYWEQKEDYKRFWQTTDIIPLQFESTFDPLIVTLINKYGTTIITLPALIGLPHKYIPNAFAYEIAMSLAGVTTGCYKLRITAGSAGPTQKIYESGWQYISSVAIPGTVKFEYWHNRFHGDVMFESGIKFQLRLPGHLGKLKPGRKSELYQDQKVNPYILSSKTFRVFPCYMGDEFGLTDDDIDLLNDIWSCNNVYIDNKSFAAVSDEFEFTETQNQPKRGVKIDVQEGLNRNSKIFAQATDTGKKLMYSIFVESKVFGDLSNQGSGNTVPIITIE
jgi:hypothetical protein